jgi:KDO2-lipid IV(A) lauroyltransferase
MSDTEQYIRPTDIDERSTFGQRVAWRLEAIAWDLVYWWPMKLLGPDRASNTAGWIVKRIAPLLSQNKTVKRNLRMAFPDWDEGESQLGKRRAHGGRTATPAKDPSV